MMKSRKVAEGGHVQNKCPEEGQPDSMLCSSFSRETASEVGPPYQKGLCGEGKQVGRANGNEWVDFLLSQKPPKHKKVPQKLNYMNQSSSWQRPKKPITGVGHHVLLQVSVIDVWAHLF